MSASFPLADDYFGPFQYLPEQLSRWKRHMRALAEQTLRDELPVFASLYENVDQLVWKLVKTKNRLRVYKPRRGAASGEAATSPCVLAVGTIEGTLEDVIYGIHNTTTRDLRVTRAFLSDTAIDAAVLHVFENGTDEDPYRSLALKWRAIQTPAGNLVKNRDACVLDYMGIEQDPRTGERYGFHISESVDHPICPPFKHLGVVRADVHIRTIYRELAGGRVGVYFHGVYNMSGQIPAILAGWTAATVACSVGNSVACAEAKKLTALALSNREATASPPAVRTRVCSTCSASPLSLTLTGRHTALKECRVCRQSVCPKCCVSRHLLTDAAKISVVCCTQCILTAKDLTVDPRRPLRLVSSAVWLAHGGEISELDGGKRALADTQRPRRPTWPIDHTPSASISRKQPVPRKPSMPSSSSWPSSRRRVENPEFTVRSVHPASHTHAELWERMQQLRVAAVYTAQLTEEVGQLMQASSAQPAAAPRVLFQIV